jgi:hypothetical protein
VITRQSNILLNLLRLRVIINGKAIYQLDKGSVAIGLAKNRPSIVVTDGFHYTKPVLVVYKHVNTYYLQIECAISNDQMLAGLIVMVLSYAVGVISGILLMKIVSFLPILYFLYIYYINRKEFIRLRGSA